MDNILIMDQMSRELRGEILSRVHKDALAGIAGASKPWNKFVRLWVETRYPEVADRCMGVHQWRLCGATDVGVAPKIPLSFYADVASGQFMLTWVPEYIDDPKNLTSDPQTIDEFYKKYTHREKSIFFPQFSDVMAEGAIKPFKGHYVLLSKDVLAGTRNNSFETKQEGCKGQRELVEEAGYRVPHLIDVLGSLLLHHMRTGEYLYSDGSNGQLLAFTRVQEDSKFKVAIGGFSASDIFAYFSYFDTDFIGVACARKSFGL